MSKKDKALKVTITVNNPKHSAKAQKALFKLGYMWVGGKQHAVNLTKKYIYANKITKKLTHSKDRIYDNDSLYSYYYYIGKYIDLRWLRKQLEMAETLYELEK